MQKHLKAFGFLLLGIFMMSMAISIPTEAGANRIVITDDSFAESLDGNLWSNPGDDVKVKKGTLLFPAKSSEYTRLITKKSFVGYEYGDEVVSAEYRLNFSNIPKGKQFILALGLSSIESVSGESGNIEIGFCNQGGLKATINVYEENNKPLTIMKPRTVAKNAKVSIILRKNKTLRLVVNGAVLYEGKVPVDGNGRVGFLQSGSCEVQVTHVNIVSNSYDHPENSNVSEDFENGKMNSNLLSSCMFGSTSYSPSTCSIQEYDGNQVLWFRNSGAAYLSTLYQYSNFEMTFDVPYLARKAEYSEEDPDVVIAPKNTWLGISVGDQYTDVNYEAYPTAYEMFVIADSAIYAWKDEYKQAAKADDNHLFYDRNETRGFSLRMRVVDGTVEFGVKWMDETEFVSIGTYQTPDGSTPLGYVHLWVMSPANIAIDNLKIVNLDNDPNLIDVEYKESGVEVPEDYAYEEMPLTYKADGETKNTENPIERLGIPGMLFFLFTAIAVIAVGMSLIYYGVKKRRGKKNGKE